MWKLRVIIICFLCLSAVANAAGQTVNFKSLKIDQKISNSEADAVKLIKVLPGKVFVRKGTGVQGEIEVLNNGDKPESFELKAWLVNDLTETVGEQSKTVTLKPREMKTITLSWPGKGIKKFGHELRVELLKKGKAFASGEEYFVSGDTIWEVGMAGAHPVAFTASHVKTKEQLEQRLEMYRKAYINAFEKFFWAPDDFADMTPDKEVYYSGQARYHEKTSFLKHLCDYGNQIGILPITYGKSIGSGSAARDVIRRKPEMVYGFGGKMAYGPDTEELAKWDRDSKKFWQGTAWAHYNMNDPAVVQHGINEIIASAKMFGWQGVRFDGHFQARTGKQRVGDKIVDFSKDMADRQTAENTRRLKEQARKAFPNFVFGYNYAQCVFRNLLYRSPRESIELCRDGGHIMDEYAKQNQGSNHPYRNWKTFADMLLEQSIETRRLGGYLYPMISTGIVGKYQMIFTLACGAHPNMLTHSNNYYGGFATRYARYIWDPDLEYIWYPNGLVIIEPTVMWDNYVRELKISDDKKLLIVHLINPPIQETATESYANESELRSREKTRREITKKAAQKKQKPDFSKLDSLPPIKLYPEPKKDVNVKIVPQAMKFQWDIGKVTLIDRTTVRQQALEVDKSDPYFWQVTVPELELWRVLVVELNRKK